MTELAESIVSDAHAGNFLPAAEVSKFSPQQIRIAIADLVRLDHLHLANALLDAGISLYPHSEDILVMGVLLAEMEQDWPRAKIHMQQLLLEQESAATVTSWQHWIRILRCNHEYHSALHAVRQALEKFPDASALAEEQQSLIALCDSVNPAETAALNQ